MKKNDSFPRLGVRQICLLEEFLNPRLAARSVGRRFGFQRAVSFFISLVSFIVLCRFVGGSSCLHFELELVNHFLGFHDDKSLAMVTEEPGTSAKVVLSCTMALLTVVFHTPKEHTEQGGWKLGCSVMK